MNSGGNTLLNELFLRAVRFEPVSRVPVWLMRQAGRSDPEYLAYRERVGLSLHELFRRPEHAVPISLLPRRIGVDAIIMFQDILTPLAPMGADFQFSPGPVLETPLRSAAQIRALKHYDPGSQLAFVGETIAGLHAELAGALPVLGFAGAPFTLAAFMIEGKSPGNGALTLAFAREQPGAFQELLDRLTRVTIDYLTFQIAAGACAVQLFESVGDLAPQPLYERFVQPSHQQIFAALPHDTPAMLFVKGSPFPHLMLASGAGVLSLSHTTPLRTVLEGGGGRIAVQGNVDNALLVQGNPAEVAQAVRDCIAEGGGRGHILNLGHGLLPATPFANVQAFVRAARETPAPAQPEGR